MENSKFNKPANNAGSNSFIKIWHLAMVVLCLAAWLTGDMAGDYKKIEHSGFIIHGCIGMVLSFAVCLYLSYGVAGPRPLRFSQWFPFTWKRLRQAGSDIAELRRFKLPEHNSRQGLSGLVQFIGVLIFFWLAITGVLIYLFIEPGSKALGVLHALKEAHEIGEILIPLYLGIHIGAVILHSLTGDHLWREIFFQKSSSVDKSSEGLR